VAIVIDDHLLIDHLAGRVSGWIAEEAAISAVYTTSSWYYRVAAAAERGSGAGALSGRITVLPDDEQRRVRARIASLPDAIGLVGARTLVPVMAALRSPRRLNFLSAEAVALALTAEATIAVRTDGPLLRLACEALHVGYRVVPAT
jgi:hypothetical protein